MALYNLLPLGYDCSPAAALRNLNIRDFALPFDWVVSNIISLEKCFSDNFAKYHTNLTFNSTHSRLIDEYGFQFPHDYPLKDVNVDLNSIGEGVFGEERGRYITEDWQKYYDVVNKKYERRIERFLNIVNGPKPIIAICRYNIDDVIKLKQLFKKYYNKTNIIFINSCTKEVNLPEMKIYSCYTEKNGTWNDAVIWKDTLDKIVASHYNDTT
jgi:hypothetical protein